MDAQSSPQEIFNSKTFFTPLGEAIDVIKKRRENKDLIQAVYNYLGGDIPEYFIKEQPILYLSRHIATPNYEALRFIELGNATLIQSVLVIYEDRHHSVAILSYKFSE